jgi:hypothetical protein
VGAILLLASAFGALSLRYVSKDKPVPSAEPGRTSLTVPCSGGRHVTSGGVEVDGDESTLDLEVGSTLPAKHNKAWRGGGNNGPAADPTADMTVTAVCAKGNFIYKTAKKHLPVDGAVRKKVSCPVGTNVVGGGVGAPGDHGVEAFISEPRDGGDGDVLRDDAWTGGEDNGSNNGTTMKVTAICSKTLHPKQVVGKKRIVNPGAQNLARVFCPSGSHVVGGASHTKPHSTDSEIADAFPVDNGDHGSTPDNGWEVDANNEGSAPLKLRSIALCAG